MSTIAQWLAERGVKDGETEVVFAFPFECPLTFAVLYQLELAVEDGTTNEEARMWLHQLRTPAYVNWLDANWPSS